MEIRRDISIGPGLIAAACVVLAFVTIGLFVRMSPAIRSILRENVESQSAALSIIEVVASRTGSVLEESQQLKLREALQRARANITIDGEEAIVDGLERATMNALVGDESAWEQLVIESRRLWEINMSVMREADADAERLGAAGAWTAVFGGIVVVLITLVTIARLRRRIAIPFEDISRVMAGQSAGAAHLRCRPLTGALELERMREQINEILDHRDTDRREDTVDASHQFALRVALVALLDADPHPTVVIAQDGEMLAGNARGLDVMATAAGPRIRSEIVKALNGREHNIDAAVAEGGVRVALKCAALEAHHVGLVRFTAVEAVPDAPALPDIALDASGELTAAEA